MTLRELLKERGISYKVVSDALGVHPNNIQRYDDLMKRSIEEVMIISKATNIDISELIGISIPAQPEHFHESNRIDDSRLLSLIESQQRTIEKQASTIENLSKK